MGTTRCPSVEGESCVGESCIMLTCVEPASFAPTGGAVHGPCPKSASRVTRAFLYTEGPRLVVSVFKGFIKALLAELLVTEVALEALRGEGCTWVALARCELALPSPTSSLLRLKSAVATTDSAEREGATQRKVSQEDDCP